MGRVLDFIMHRRVSNVGVDAMKVHPKCYFCDGIGYGEVIRRSAAGEWIRVWICFQCWRDDK